MHVVTAYGYLAEYCLTRDKRLLERSKIIQNLSRNVKL